MIVKMLKKNNEVWCNGQKCKINAQASKGEGQEVAIIEPIVGPEWQKFISLSTLKDDIELDIELKPRKHVDICSLTADEQAEIDELQSRIDEIKAKAKNRKPKALNQMTISELEAYVAAKRAELKA